MLQNWLAPLPVLEKEFEDWQFAASVKRYDSQNGLPDLKQVQVGLIGLGQENSQACRDALYPLSFPFSLKVADLGNVRSGNVAFLVPLFRELLASGIIPVLLAPDPSYLLVQYKACLHELPNISLGVLDERIDYRPMVASNTLNQIIEHPDGRLFQLHHIGAQAHFTSPSVFKALEERYFDYYRLGRARANLQDLEPALRDVDVLGIDLRVFQAGEVAGLEEPSPSGFLLEEGCRICRYTGMSDKIKSIGFFGFRTELDDRDLGAQAIAQLIWYFLDGLNHRKGDFPLSFDGLLEYIVQNKDLGFELTFWKSSKSGRWWMQIPVGKLAGGQQRHRLAPCSYNDYLKASQGELPERLLRAISRFK